MIKTNTQASRLAVVGVGRVGLPLALSFADAGLQVIGLDRDPDHVATINSGRLPFIEHGAQSVLDSTLASGSFRVTTNPEEAISDANSVVVTVGTPLSNDLRADTSQIESALEEIAPWLGEEALVVMRSTVSAGTTDRTVVPTLERLTGMKVGSSLFVAFCPERIAEGFAMEELRSLPEIVGGVENRSTERAASLFQLLDKHKVIHRTDALSAELAKLYTNVYRYVTFALANEYALIAEHYGRNAHEIISLLREGYPRAPVPLPGPAGGPCLSKDGYFLIEELTFPDFVLTAWKLNDSIPAHLVSRLTGELTRNGLGPESGPVTVLGTAFKADIDDDRQSPSLRAIDSLRRAGYEVRIHDPYLAPGSVAEIVTGSVGILLATNHREYLDLNPVELAAVTAPGCVVADAWAVLDPRAWSDAGFSLLTLGRA